MRGDGIDLPRVAGAPTVSATARFSADDFQELADKFRQAATLLMIAKTPAEGDDDVISAFVRYAEMLKQAAETEKSWR